MAIKIGINGFGRIGRLVLRSILERGDQDQFDVVAVNVWRDEELSVSMPVRPDGKITVPLIGDVQAGGPHGRERTRRVTVAVGAAGVVISFVNT